jgi:CAAX prenyl protease N-terminal, five membrane helices
MEATPAVRYHRVARLLAIVSLLLQLGLLFAFQQFGWSSSFSQYSLALAGNYYIALLFYWSGICLMLTAGLAAASTGVYLLERHHTLTRQSYRSWLADYLKGRLINWLITSSGVVWFYCAVRHSPERWYLWFWPAIVLFYAGTLLLIDSVFLPIFYKVVPLESGSPSCRWETKRSAPMLWSLASPAHIAS